MKILISARGQSPGAEVDPRFGRADWFLVYDTGEKSWEAVSNESAQSASQGAGIQAAEAAGKAGAEAVITGHVGPKAFAVLRAAGMRIYRGDARTAGEAAEAFERGQLPELRDPNGP
jgi:predicted Fe-Mo cluster-binding NifX family protein